MIGTSVPATSCAASQTAEICGTPTPEITRVVQIDPGPIPTLIPSAPDFKRSRQPSRVATFPAITCISHRFLISWTVSITLLECPCAESTTSTSTPLEIRFSALSKSNTPTAAPTRKRPCLSLHAFGNRFSMSISLMVIRPVRTPSPSTSSNFSTLFAMRTFSASSSVTAPVAVTSPV